MSSLSSLQNLCMYSLGPTLSGQVSTNLESQITGLQDMTRNQVNQAIYLGTSAMIAKTDGSIQNIKIAQEFLQTTLTALQTVNEELVNASKAILTLLNGVVSAADKKAAVDGILNVMGMIDSPKSRDAQEGNVIKTLRQAGTGQSPFYKLTTTEGGPDTPGAAAPSAPITSGNNVSAAEKFYFNGTGSVPATTFCDPNTVAITGLSSADVGTIENATAAGTGITDLVFTVDIGGVTYSSEATDLTGAKGKGINIYNAEDRSKYLTIYTAPDYADFADAAAATTAFTALMQGSIDSSPASNATSGIFTSSGTTTTGTFADPAVTPPSFKGVEPGAIDVLSASCATGQFAVQVGAHVYATDPADVLDMTTVDDTTSPRVLYLNGDSTSSQTITLAYEADFASNTNAFTDDAATVAAFKGYMAGTYTAPSGSDEPLGVFRHDGTASPTGSMLPCNPASFVEVPAGKITVEAVDYGATGNGSDANITVKVGENTFKTAAGGANVVTADGTVVLYKDGDDSTPAPEQITLQLGPITSNPAGPPPVGIIDADTLKAEVEAALSGSYAVPGQETGGASTPFAFNPGSNFGAGYFTVNYDGAHISFADQFGQQIGSYPLDDRKVMEAAQGTGELEVGNLGTLHVDPDYAGGGFTYQLTTTPTPFFDAVVTVSASDGTRYIEIPNLADQKTLWGSNETIDANLLLSNTAYQQKVKGMIDHATTAVKETIQYASNVLSVINNDEQGQNATMESLSNLQDTVSKADAVQTAQAVFESTQSYLKMIQSMSITAQVMAQEKVAANQIAQLAVAGA